MRWRKKEKPADLVYLAVDAAEFADSIHCAMVAALGAGPVRAAFERAVQDKATQMVAAILPGTHYYTEVGEAVRSQLGNIARWEELTDRAVAAAMRREIEAQVTKAVHEVAPTSERYQEIKEECAEQLRRWPALKNDPAMHLKVSQTILSSFQKTG